MESLEGKVAWVTGAGSGIGEAGAVALAREGAGHPHRPAQGAAGGRGRAHRCEGVGKAVAGPAT